MKGRSDGILARVAQRRYWSEVEGRLVVAAWRRSGESQTRFAAQHGIHLKRLGWWIARLKSPLKRGQPVRQRPVLRFHPVRVVEEGRRETEPIDRIEIVLAEGTSVRVPPRCASADLRGVLTLLTALARGERSE